MNNKRSRSSNWSELEKSLLTQLIKDKIQIIENKDVTKNNNQIKKTAWQEILQSFNEINDTKRDLTQLINQWRNTKNNIKKRNYEYRRNCTATGGGPRPPSPPPEDVEIMEILPNEFVVDVNKFDSDSLNIKKDHEVTEHNIIIDVSQPGCSGTLQPQMDKNVVDCVIEVVESNKPECTSTSLPTQMDQKEMDMKTPKKRVMKIKKRDALDEPESQQLFQLAKSVRMKQLQQHELEHKVKLKMMEMSIR